MPNKYLLPIICFLGILLFPSCETSRSFYEKEEKGWKAQPLPDPDGLAHTVFLIGDAGEPKMNPPEKNFQVLAKELQAAGENSSVVFLGDNIYPAGLPPENHPGRAQAESRINAQLDILKVYEGKVYFIPGNHDWNKMTAPGGLDAVRRQEAYIESYLDNKKVFYPKDGCGNPKAIEVNDDLTIILVDSQWWLHQWDKEPDMHKGCKIDSWEELEVELSELVDEYDDGNILICMHHPIHTQGSHGGFFPLKEHLFPLTYLSKGLLIPLPIIGSFHPTARYLGVTRQDPAHPDYQDLINAVNEATWRKDSIVIASGHEHNLQYFFEDDKHYIVSGSGSKPSYVKPGYDARFNYGKEGFAKVYYYKDGSVWMEMLAAEPRRGNDHVIFRKRLKDTKLKAPRDPEKEFGDVWATNMPDSVGYIVAPNYAAGKGKKLLLGRNYRDAWATEVILPVLNLDTLKGGLHPLRKGGGRQSKTMRLEADNGKQYVLRGLYKNAALTLPDFARGTAVEDIFQDQMSMDHPYGAQIISPLADAVGVYHTSPSFFYLPEQPRLGEFNTIFAGEAYLFEERPAKDRSDVAGFGRSEKIVSYRKMLKETRENQDHLIDQDHAMKSRLFDILIGDWDRHDDQWRWATFKEDGKTLYRPVPRDRDHAFLSFRGFLPWLASRKWGARQLRSFNHEFHDIRGLCFNARFFDRQYLNEMDLEDWLKGAEYIQSTLGNRVIEEAVNLWPESLYALNGKEIISKLKSRREILPEVVKEYYRFLAREVDVPGTEEKDLFEVTRMPGGKTQVQVFSLNKKGEKDELWYDRTFDRKITKEIRLYGLKKDDQFIINGQSGANSIVRVIGGTGEDLVRDQSSVKGGKRTKVYDSVKEENILELGTEGKDLTSDDPFENRYNRQDFKYPKTIPLIFPGVNPDDGFLLNAGFIRQLHGFRKNPYKVQHQLMASFAFATSAANIKYSGDFIEYVGKWDFTADLYYHGSTFVDNFFGLGNNTINTATDRSEFNFNRLRYGQFSITPGLKKRFALNTMNFAVKLHYTQTKVDRTDGRISDSDFDNLSGLIDSDFEQKKYGGIQLGYHIDKLDHKNNPTRGIKFNMTSSWNFNVEDTQKNYLDFKTDLAIYYRPFSPFPLTLAARGGFAANFGEYEFFQANFLGRGNNLRGFRANRFGGDSFLYGNLEGRLKLFYINSRVLPADFGLTGFYDIGRVWYEEDPETEAFQTWHKGWGGGFYLFAYEMLTLNANYTTSVESNFLEIKLGFFF